MKRYKLRCSSYKSNIQKHVVLEHIAAKNMITINIYFNKIINAGKKFKYQKPMAICTDKIATIKYNSCSVQKENIFFSLHYTDDQIQIYIIQLTFSTK